ncbi:MAG: hypothetical protein AAGC78_10250 [Cellvibrio sp.]|uniref:hypothetical protein n=1 Tax=Cellvibrio sp. TaxID=1965322 RepID=UPI0031AB1E7A
MAKQTLIWTCLPNGISADEKEVRISVMVAPKLDAEANAQELSSFPEWLDWPATLASARFSFVANGQVIAKSSLGDIEGASRHDTTIGSPDSDVWCALFKANFYVESYDVQRDVTDLLDSNVLSYSTVEVQRLVKEMYADLAVRTNENLPRIGADLLDNNLWRDLVESVQQVDRWGNKRHGKDFLPENNTAESKIGRRFATLDALLKAGDTIEKGSDLQRKIHHLARFELFHTPPLRPKAIKQVARTDDKRISETVEEFERPPEPSKEDLVKTMHFHRAIAAMNNYPTLLRRLGLVVDFSLSRDQFPKGDNIALEVMVEFSEGLATPLNINIDSAPITYVTHDQQQFLSTPNPGLNPEQAIRIHQGLLDIYSHSDSYAVVQADIDSAALKLMNFARSLGTYDAQAKVDPAILLDDVSRHEKRAGAPSLRTAGISLVRKDRGDLLKQRFAVNKQHLSDAQTQQGIQFWAEDLVRGYRIDVWDTKVKVWRSLCRRTADYMFAAERLLVNPLAGEEEATVQMAATRSPDPTYNQDILYLHESMVSWGGWSLAAPQPGRAIGKDTKADKGSDGRPQFTEGAEALEGLDFKSQFKAVPGSLPRLRYGRRYALRARAVDIAGNSLQPTEQNIGPENPEKEAQAFLRFEPIAAPILALPGISRDHGVKQPDFGESMYRLVIRSFNDSFDDSSLSTQQCERFAVPPQSTIHEAELHGVLDHAGTLNSAAYEMLAKEKDFPINDANASLWQTIFPMKGPLDREGTEVDTHYAVWNAGARMSYLADPMAQVVSAWFVDHPAISPQETIRIPLYRNDATWPEAEPFRIDLYEDVDPLAKTFYEEQSHVLRVPLAKGERVKLRLSMRILKRDLVERMGLWQWLDEAAQQKIAKATLDGRSWLFTPWQEIDLVHAVQRPLIQPDIRSIYIDRNIGSTFAIPRLFANCSLKSTDRLDLQATWHEPMNGSDVGDVKREDMAFQVKITDIKDFLADQHALRDHSLPSEEHGPDVIGINKPRTDFESEKRHEFGDTRYRRIEYRLNATTRYREYLPPELLFRPGFDATGEPAQTEEHIHLYGASAVTWIPNSAPPPAPEVLYVVPTFGWSRARTEDGAQHIWRRGGGLRVYLDRPWNSSGYGEMLAVVLPESGYTKDPEKDPLSRPSKSFITQWGSDPIWNSPAVAGLAPRISNFPRARLQPDATGRWLPPGAPASEAKQMPGEFQTRLSVGDSTVDIAPHDVYFDEERKLWYCDIEIDHGDSYWPFVRLALARYQPTSVGGAHLSEIVLADFMQLTMDRWATIRHNSLTNGFDVSLHGSTYSNSAGAREVLARLPRFQQRSPAATSVVEVWLERLDPSLGTDFGWRRVAEGNRKQTNVEREEHSSETITINRFSTFERLQFSGLRNSISGSLIRTNRIDSNLIERWIKPKPLWEGFVESPRDITSEGYRIVIAEYEEYPTDDNTPYTGVPLSKGRRLVFVEHIELR